ncbi:protein obstructor-E-like isoform X2 [Varroa jacobsoni]|uniref:Chitin-binding type-2 domain-containing protein n=1 Tax=Varroa destructor TaxID=109461 RepID=A0A7M7KXB5_VARDE|nr:protein obstructor-E-like isoform X2 [Varroa destructor]XP_022705850.1 protein obstructor-E-like isoform X2 [Varroa jacobsoni]
MLPVLVPLVAALASSALGQAGFKCPTKNGYYPDKEQCDMYYECRHGVPKPKLCDDGMAFIWTNNPLYAKCDVITNVDCSERPYLQQAKTSPHCPRANGYYRHEKWPQICDEFYQCDKGKVKVLKCQPGLAFDPESAGCQWAAKVKGCEHLANLPKPPGHAENQYEDDYEDDAQQLARPGQSVPQQQQQQQQPPQQAIRRPQ